MAECRLAADFACLVDGHDATELAPVDFLDLLNRIPESKYTAVAHADNQNIGVNLYRIGDFCSRRSFVEVLHCALISSTGNQGFSQSFVDCNLDCGAGSCCTSDTVNFQRLAFNDTRNQFILCALEDHFRFTVGKTVIRCFNLQN